MTDRDPLSIEQNDFCFIDTETRSLANLKETGVHQYIAQGRVIIVTYAIGDGEIHDWSVPTFTKADRLNWQECPDDLYAFYRRALKGEAWFVAWNSGFDRIALSRGVDLDPKVQAELGHDVIPVDTMIDAMAQAVKSHLPPDLMGASQYTGGPVGGWHDRYGLIKQSGGKALIHLFSDEQGTATPQTHRTEWAQFLSYAIDDVAAMRHIFQSTLPLGLEEWEEFWVNEKINDRGLPIDVAFVTKAADLAALNREKAHEAVAEISKGALHSVNQNAAMLDWVSDRLAHLPQAEAILTRAVTTETSEDGDTIAIVEKSLEATRVEELVLMLEAMEAGEGLTDGEHEAYLMLMARQYGGSATPGKFIKMLPMLHEGRIKGQYVFNGAAATGRFSSRGLQVHNLTRSVVSRVDASMSPADAEIAALEMITFGGGDTNASYDAIQEAYGNVGKALSRLIRPSIFAPEGRTLFWADWSAIEARGLPWLADTPSAKQVLEVFAETDLDSSLPDIYKRQAGSILHKAALDVTKSERQSHGKVPVLSLGFGGGEGALHAMARNYGVFFTAEEAKAVVVGWREANPWAGVFWGALWQAATSAIANPGHIRTAGRVAYVYEQTYRKGTLVAFLPCGRALLYPSVRWELRDVKNKRTGEVETKTQLTYRRGRGRSALWYGTLAENATQGICGSLLRWALREYETRWPGLLIGHTHDEIIGEAGVGEADEAAARLAEVMSTGPSWAAGLPLAASSDIHDWYSKAVD